MTELDMTENRDEQNTLPEANENENPKTEEMAENGETEPEVAPEESPAEPDKNGESDKEAGSDPAAYYAEIEQNDLRELAAEFPELAGMKSLTALKNPVRYGALRDLGLTPREAYLATGGKARISDNRSHLRSAVPSGIGGIGDSMSIGELSEARALFEGLSDSEIRRLYKKVKN